MNGIRVFLLSIASAALVACGGGGDDTGSGASNVVQSPPPAAGIGNAGGTVHGPSGAQVVIPAGALSQNVAIEVAQSSAGAPALPAGINAVGEMFAFTPHGTTFASPVTVTVPFDPARVTAGATPALYKTTAGQAGWETVPGATVNGSTMTASITSFSHAVVATPAPPPPLQRAVPERSWEYKEFLADDIAPNGVEAPDQDGKPNSQTGGTVSDEHDFGPLPLQVNGDSTATGAVFSSETGTTYWVFAQGPSGSILTPLSKIGNRVSLVQRQGFKKTGAGPARLKLHVTRVFIEAIDANGTEILYPECPWSLECGLTMSASVTLDVKAYAINTFFTGRNSVELFGSQGNWDARGNRAIEGRQSLWRGDAFVLNRDAGGFGSGQHATVQLKEPITIEIEIPERQVGEGQSFTLMIEAVAETMNRRQRESYVAAFLRDPLGIEGATIETFNLEPVAVPYEDPPEDQPVAPECDTGADPEAGTIQFAAATFLAPEIPRGGARVLITRTGGSRGEASARVTTQDGSAHAGADYQAVDTIVYFGDGDDTPRTLEVPIVLDREAEPDKTVNLTLGDPRGCVGLGAPSTATVTILDDDRPEPTPPPSGLDPTFGTGGKAALPGFGGGESDMAVQADGRIVMVGGRFTDFVMARFNADGSLDTSFGVDGKVTTDIAGGFAQERARAVAIQADGKIVVAGEAAPVGDSVVALARYNTDGSLDASFGAGGKVTSVSGRAFAVAIQDDGKIVIAGDAPVTRGQSDFADLLLARFNADGTLDAGFGIGGARVLDVGAGTNLARNLLLLADGHIVVAGDPFGSNANDRTAVVRFDSRGSLDNTFGTGGAVVIDGRLGRGLALQPDGKLLLVGASTVLATSEFAMMRLNPDGTTDTAFGANGLVTTPVSNSTSGTGDIAQAVAVHASGRIYVAGVSGSPNQNFALARYTANGQLDSTFASGGSVTVDFNGLTDSAESLALLADGRILLGGVATPVSSAAYGLIRVNP
jgi:uncharacterized delta-60 repeat protein